jgi:hypothetical protein
MTWRKEATISINKPARISEKLYDRITAFPAISSVLRLRNRFVSQYEA